jgi:hypothetical protein
VGRPEQAALPGRELVLDLARRGRCCGACNRIWRRIKRKRVALASAIDARCVRGVNALETPMTRYLDSYRLTCFATLMTCGVLAGCTADPPPDHAPAEDRVIEQLELSREALSVRGLPLQLVGYTPAAPLDTEDAVRDAKARLLAGDALVPTYDGVHPSSLALATIDERAQAFQAGAGGQDVIANLQTMALPLIELGQHTMDVTWESEGRRFETKLVYDDNGVVYDNLLSNLVFVEAREPIAETRMPGVQPEPGAATAGSSGIAALANESWSTRFLDLTIQWLWGGTRGQVQIDHYVISCDGWISFCDDGGAVNAWMSLGSAEGQIARNALIYPRISKLAWAYGWATPTASFSITWNADTLTFSASTSGVGSAGKGSGIHAIY